MFSLKEAISSTPQHPKSLPNNKLVRAGGELRPLDFDLPGEQAIRELFTASMITQNDASEPFQVR
jgi:hypothetical protein